MKLGVLFSGGKDSVYALQIAREGHEVVCLITIISENIESYMFHTPNIDLTELQAEAIGLPLIRQVTQGEKEVELDDLRTAIRRAKHEFGIEGIVTGAIESVYQASRVRKICDALELWCYNPLWKKDQTELLRELLDKDYEVMISGAFAYPFTEDWLGRRLDSKMIEELVKLHDRFGISPSGEGGEIETTVLDAQFFRKRVRIVEQESRMKNYAGTVLVKKAELVDKT